MEEKRGKENGQGLKLCSMQCGRAAVTKGYCRPCYMRMLDPRVTRVRGETTCIACGVTIQVYPEQRYCRAHERLRNPAPPASLSTELRRDSQVLFRVPEPEELLSWAVMSIWILRPDGTVDVEQSEGKRGRWLTPGWRGPARRDLRLPAAAAGQPAPRHRRPAGRSMAAMTLIVPPHWEQSSGSTS
jgi:hypothetical protein